MGVIHGRKIDLIVVAFAVSLAIGCKKLPDAKPVSFGVLEVVKCIPGGANPVSVKDTQEKHCISSTPIVSEKDLRLADPSRDEAGRPQLILYFTRKGGDRLREVTQRISWERAAHGEEGKLGIMIDGKLIAAPTVKGTVEDSAVLGEGFTKSEVEQLAASLNASRPRN